MGTSKQPNRLQELAMKIRYGVDTSGYKAAIGAIERPTIADMRRILVAQRIILPFEFDDVQRMLRPTKEENLAIARAEFFEKDVRSACGRILK